MARLALRVLVLGSLAAASCNTPPPRTWVRYQPAGPTNWERGANGLLVGTFHGAQVTLDLGQPQTRIEVTVANPTAAPVEFCMGPDAARPKGPIGEVLLRPLSPPGVGGPDYLPYSAMQRVVVEAGWTGKFHLDMPLGREPSLMQYFVFAVEGRNAAGNCERRTLPLQATNAGTLPPTGS